MDRDQRVAAVNAGKASEARAELLSWFERCGYIRRYNPERREREGQHYKKGYEVRFVLGSEGALQAVKRLLTAVKLRPGKPFHKHQRIVLPLYGRETVEWFVNLLSRGRERARLGFGPDGRRLTRRSPAPDLSPAPERLPGSPKQPDSATKPSCGKRRLTRPAPN